MLGLAHFALRPIVLLAFLDYLRRGLEYPPEDAAVPLSDAFPLFLGLLQRLAALVLGESGDPLNRYVLQPKIPQGTVILGHSLDVLPLDQLGLPLLRLIVDVLDWAPGEWRRCLVLQLLGKLHLDLRATYVQ
jgi:hypothetical protein